MGVMWASLLPNIDSNFHLALIISSNLFWVTKQIQGPESLCISFNFPSYPNSRRRVKRVWIKLQHFYTTWDKGNLIRWGVHSLTPSHLQYILFHTCFICNFPYHKITLQLSPIYQHYFPPKWETTTLPMFGWVGGRDKISNKNALVAMIKPVNQGGPWRWCLIYWTVWFKNYLEGFSIVIFSWLNPLTPPYPYVPCTSTNMNSLFLL